MKKTFLLLLALTLSFTLTGCFKGQTISEITDPIISECQNLCSQIEEICPGFLSSERCNTECENWNEETMEIIRQASNCQELFIIPEVVAASVPEINDPELAEPKNDCEAACNNYVNQCLTLVPNATQALFQEGFDSCIQECAGWNETMTRCMIQASNCESMTDVCGL